LRPDGTTTKAASDRGGSAPGKRKAEGFPWESGLGSLSGPDGGFKCARKRPWGGSAKEQKVLWQANGSQKLSVNCAVMILGQRREGLDSRLSKCPAAKQEEFGKKVAMSRL